MASYGRTAKLGVLWGLASRGANELISIPSSFILARLLTPHDFGVAAAAGFFIQLAQRMTNFGFNTALIQFAEITETHKATVFAVNLLVGTAMWIVLTLAAPWLGAVFHSAETAAVLPLAALVFVFGSLGSVPSALMVRDLQFRETAAIDTAAIGVTAGISIVLALNGFGYWSLVWAQLVAAVLQTAVRLYACGWWPWLTFSRAHLGQLLSFGMGIHVKRLLDSTAQNVDNLIIGRTLGLPALGIYDKAFTMTNRVVSALATAGPTASFRVFALIHDDHQRFANAYRKVLLTSTLVAYPLLTALIVVAADLFDVMFGSQWTAAVVPFQILCLAGMFKITTAYASTCTQSKGRVWGEVWRQLVYVTLIVGAVAFGSRWGLAGASLGVLIATVLMSALMHELLRRIANLSLSDMVGPQLPAILCAVGVGATLLLANAAWAALVSWEPRSWERLLLDGLVSAVFYAGYIRFVPFRSVRQVVAETVHEFAPRLNGVMGCEAPHGAGPIVRKPIS